MQKCFVSDFFLLSQNQDVSCFSELAPVYKLVFLVSCTIMCIFIVFLFSLYFPDFHVSLCHQSLIFLPPLYM